jgi:phage antirepressor YoqD-like protein
MELNPKSTETKVQQISILTKESTENEIKAYFQKVLELKQSGEEFPVNLELVWPLVYSEKGKAVRALTAEFIEGVDYQVLTQNDKNPSGGRPVEDYHLSVSCMEYFIARKVRSVFDVYRKVFHKAVEQKTISKVRSDDETVLMAMHVLQRRIEESKQRVQILEGENEHLTKEVKVLAPKAEYTDSVLQSTSTHTMTQVAKELGMSAVALEKKLHDAGVIFRQSGQWFLYAKYQDRDYTGSRTHYYNRNDGTTGTNTITVWTETGRQFIHQLMKGDLL